MVCTKISDMRLSLMFTEAVKAIAAMIPTTLIHANTH